MKIRLLVAVLVAVLGSTMTVNASAACCGPDAACCKSGPCC
jgi:hypothetical protein